LRDLGSEARGLPLLDTTGRGRRPGADTNQTFVVVVKYGLLRQICEVNFSILSGDQYRKMADFIRAYEDALSYSMTEEYKQKEREVWRSPAEHQEGPAPLR
jgi:hypothetical protein